MENLHDKRQVYEQFELHDHEVKENPMEHFKEWFADADKHPDIFEANAMILSTIDDDGCPRTRAMLLKSYSQEGFVFYTNYNSKKGKSIDKNKVACLYFFWPALERQVMIKARLEKVSPEMSDEYFASRPRGSRLGAWASEQGEEIPSKAYLAQKLQDLEKEFEGKEVTRPPHWGGYLAKPYEIEFWQGRPNRLHDRIVYQFQDGKWKTSRLAP
ncbi:MAG: pyridoxamine 5'-phosphate oxidase [Flavobacteriaceae bacterium]|jgi:pyridoxamine 5'-phosphate oxidase|nr:pyridoxamine 5'-phosphate oxidase [Flavobacteriaceae bacterium]